MDAQLSFTKDDLLQVWERIGKSNRWIREAYDPPFDKGMIKECQTLADLEEQLKHHSWGLGQGFCYQNLCFINQRDAEDIWLTIKNDTPFQSCSYRDIIEKGRFHALISRFLAFTDAQLKDQDD